MSYTIKLSMTILLLCFSSHLEAINNQSDTTKAVVYFNLAESFFYTNNYDSAESYYEKAAIAYKNDNKWGEFLLVTYYRGEILYSKRDRNNEAIDWLLSNLNQVPKQDTSIEVLSKKTDIYLSVAQSYRNLGQYREAIRYFDKALLFTKYAKKERKEAAITGKAVTYWLLGDYEKALIFQKDALNILQNYENTPVSRLIVINNILGLIHVGLGNYNKGVTYYNKCISLLDIPKNKNMELMASVNTNLGIVHRILGNNQKALEHYKLAHHIFTKHNFAKSNIATVLIEMGKVHLYSKKYADAQIYFNESLKISLEIFNHDHLIIARSYSHLAETYELSGQLDLAFNYFEKALKIRLNILGEHSHLVAYTYNRISDLFAKKELYREALKNLDKSIISNVGKSMKDLEKYSLTELFENSLSRLEFLITLKSKASILQSLYNENQEVDNLLLALHIYELCDSFIDNIRSSHQEHSDKVELTQTSSDFFIMSIALCWKLYQRTGENQYLEKAFFFSEKNKTTTLYSNIIDISAKKNAGIPDSLLAKEKELKIDLSFHKSQELHELGKTESDTLKLKYTQKNIFNLSRKLEDLISLFENNYPKYYSNKSKLETVSINKIQKKILKGNQLLIEYFLADSSLYIFAINKTDYKIEKTKIDSTFYVNFLRFRNSLKSPKLIKQTKESFDEYTSSAHYLYRKLLLPIQDQITGKDLIIIPDGKLALIPFEALLPSRTDFEDASYQTLPYLIKSHNVTYANSATSLVYNMKETKSHLNNGSVLAFAPVFNKPLIERAEQDTVRSTLGPLGWNEKEVLSIAAYFDSKNYIGESATEKSFKQNSADYKIIHVASHALLDDENPLYSKIAFTLDEKDSLNDGYLHTFELFNSQLNSDMVVLSACNTGYGKVQKGEGVMSLGYAFAYAGVPSVVMSHWQVDDKSTYLLMENFYKHLADGMVKSEALRKAKLSLLEHESIAYAHPYYWGAFVAYGDDTPIVDTNKEWIWYATFILALIFVISIFALRKSN